MAKHTLRAALLAAILTLSACAPSATLTQLDYAQTACLARGDTQACAEVPALQAQANAEANQTISVATIALLPLAILLGGLEDDSGPHYHHHYHHRY